MQWHEKINAAIDYIEEHLAGEIDVCEAARIARCSEYHFRRMFAFVAGVPVSEYIRRRRMTLAALDLHGHTGDLERIAAKYGYRSPDSFARAFTAMHGVSPAKATAATGAYATWPRMTFHLSITGGDRMDVRLEDKSEFTIIGFKKRIPIQFEGINPEVESMVNGLSDDDWELLDRYSDTEPRGVIQAVTNFDEDRPEEKGRYDHYIGAATTRGSTDGMATLSVPATTWAIFRSAGAFPEALQSTWGRIYSEWFPSVEYELSGGPELLCSGSDDASESRSEWEIWIPVRTYHR